MLYECNKNDERSGFKKGDRIAIECKWTNSDAKDRALRCDKLEEESYRAKSVEELACSFYLAVGVGWNVAKSKPMEIYLIPNSAINKDLPETILDKYFDKYKVKRKTIFEKNESLVSTRIDEDVLHDIIKKTKDIVKQVKKDLT